MQAATVAEARAIQEGLRERVEFRPPAGFAPRIVAGADVAFDRPKRVAIAAVVLIDLETLETLETATATEPIAFPYVPGYLSFRELPALAVAWERLRRRPDLAVFDAHGFAHPRRAGLASHAGIAFDLPAIGCAKSVLCGVPGAVGVARGSTAPLVDPDDGAEIGRVVRTRTKVRPVYVSVGHRIDLNTAVELILRLAPDGRYRFPETTRRADRLAAETKKAAVSVSG